MNMHRRHSWRDLILFWGTALTLILLSVGQAHAADLVLTQAALSGGKLSIQGTSTTGAAVELYDLAGRKLWSGQGASFAANLDASAWPEPVCAVRAKSGSASALLAVKGAPKDCAKAPSCQITKPAAGIEVQANRVVSFAAGAKLKDQAAAPLRMEWDFAGGVYGQAIPGTAPTAYKRPDTPRAKVQFVRDNATYRVRFMAWDKMNRYCEDSVLVTVGHPPTGLPDLGALVKEAQDGAPKPGSQLTGQQGELVVLPFADLTMPGNSDSRYTPNLEQFIGDSAFSNLNAVAYRKDRLPIVQDGSAVALRYAAGSNPADPVGADSINSTSQNWPLNADPSVAAPLDGAAIQKTDLWEIFQRPAADLLAPSYTSRNWPSINPEYKDRVVGPDEGLVIGPVPGDSNVPEGTAGRYMPGRAQPYAANTPQPFTGYDQAEQKHLARAIPLTDIDDAGRVNPLPVVRVEAADQAGQGAAATDAVVAAGRDMHCRECHAKGKIGANDRLDWNALQSAFHSSGFYGNRGCWFPEPFCSLEFAPPEFVAPASPSLFDQELAANRNVAALHSFYDNTGENGMANGWFSVEWSGQQGVTKDEPNSCNWCHSSRINAQAGRFFHNFYYQSGETSEAPTPPFTNLSEVMHNWHDQLQLDPADSSSILRAPSGRPKLWNPTDGPNPNSLFPAVDAQGNSLPMEQNCLRCHSGHREQIYRDRMYSAGVTCYDCHGGMSAVGAAHDKPRPGPDGNLRRFGWYEQPDCGSCHIGNANRGKDGKDGFYSAGVLRRAFEDADPSATSRKPPSPRFAVQPGLPFQAEVVDDLVSANIEFASTDYWLTMTLPLFRQSHDTHGNVPCAACHGGAHENWPNRDPKANDNLTAVQLQGHTGPVLECNVCHTADAFRLQGDLDGGTYSGDTKAGILGGPHNLHPVNDPYWFKSSVGDTANQDGTKYGGWHNNYAKKPGLAGEDQCAACHGNDHKGTRLSKTPVDRVFDFSGLDFAKLQAAGFKAKVVKVAAGTEIGCDTCHSIETSCIGSPAGKDCGTASAFMPATANRDPVITSVAVEQAVIGQPYAYQVTATDPDGDPLTYSLAARPWYPDTMTVDASGMVRYGWPEAVFSYYNFGALTFPYTVRVTDGKGGYATQTIRVTATCPTGQAWVNTGWDGHCLAAAAGAAITSQPGTHGLNAGDSYRYKVVAASGKGLALSYSLLNPPKGMDIGAKNGVVTWQAPPEGGLYAYTVKAADADGGVAYQTVTVTVCAAPKRWSEPEGQCQ
jgi:hypothetical protein